MKKLFICFVLISSLVFTLSPSYAASKRDKWQKPMQVLKAISTKDDREKVFCEVGAGKGYFSLKAARLYKKVYASDIDKKALDQLSQKIISNSYQNVSIIRGKESDPLFPKKKCDIIFMSLVYHHIENRVDYLIGLRKYLTGSGKIVNLDNVMDIKRYEGTGKRLPAKECRFPKAQFIKEAKLANYSNIKVHDVLPMQYLIELL